MAQRAQGFPAAEQQRPTARRPAAVRGNPRGVPPAHPHCPAAATAFERASHAAAGLRLAAEGGPKRLILYDLDGTLVDTGEDITRAINHMLRALSDHPLSVEQVRQHVAKGLHGLVQRCLETEEEPVVRRGMWLFYDHYGRHLTDHSRLYPGVTAFLESFHDRTQAIITNKPHPFPRMLADALGIGRYFVEIIPPNDRYPKKPHPAAIHALMQRYRVRPDQTVMIGDSLIDLEMARNAGVLAVLVRHGYEDPDALDAARPEVMVNDFAELLALAKQRGW